MGDKFENISNSTINNRSVINNQNANKSYKKVEKEEIFAQKMNFKNMIAEGRIDECISDLSDYFEQNKSKIGINSISEISAKHTRITLDRNLENISEEIFSVSSAKLRAALMFVIDTEIR
jgi:hypothetical protein